MLLVQHFSGSFTKLCSLYIEFTFFFYSYTRYNDRMLIPDKATRSYLRSFAKSDSISREELLVLRQNHLVSSLFFLMHSYRMKQAMHKKIMVAIHNFIFMIHIKQKFLKNNYALKLKRIDSFLSFSEIKFSKKAQARTFF